MTESRFELVQQETAENNRSKTGLELDVIDHYTGKKRSVKTLSGGEAFQASLALALGMSDVVQSQSGGIQLDALFIDEGFGSLDEEALEQSIPGAPATGGRTAAGRNHLPRVRIEGSYSAQNSGSGLGAGQPCQNSGVRSK